MRNTKQNIERRQRRKRIIMGIVAGILVLLMALGALSPLMRVHGADIPTSGSVFYSHE